MYKQWYWWTLVYFTIVLFSISDLLRDGYALSNYIRQTIMFDYHLLKFSTALFLIISIIIIKKYINTHFYLIMIIPIKMSIYLLYWDFFTRNNHLNTVSPFIKYIAFIFLVISFFFPFILMNLKKIIIYKLFYNNEN